MGAIILFTVLMSGLISVPISLVLWVFFRRNIVDPQLRKRIDTKCTTLSLFIFAVIFFFPVDYGPAGSNYDTWVTIWLTKTLLIIFTPPILAFIFTRGISLQTNTEEMQPSVYYGSLDDAIKAQTNDTTINNPEIPKTRTDYPSLVLVTLILISLAAFNEAFMAGNKPLSTVALVTCATCCIAYLLWLPIRSRFIGKTK
jgi:hypothetical protein